jgi:hypothetical protein
MKRWNIICSCVAIAYVIIIALLVLYKQESFVVREDNGKFDNCTYDNPCQTYCEGANYERYTDDFIRENFPNDNFPNIRDDEKGENGTVDFRILKHKVKCNRGRTTEIMSNYNDWQMYRVRICWLQNTEQVILTFIKFKRGAVETKNDYFSDHEYCLEPYEESGKFRLKLEVCIVDLTLVNVTRFFRKCLCNKFECLFNLLFPQ